MQFYNLLFTKPVQHSVFYDCLHSLLPLGLAGALNTTEEEDDSVTQLII